MSSLPPEFRHIHLTLAREPSHPHGSRAIGYDFAAPLDQDNRLAAEIWKKHRDHCRVRRFVEGQDDIHGRLARTPAGRWFFDFDPTRDSDDQQGFRLGEERFVPGEYVSIEDEHGAMHTYIVVSVEAV